jgi:RimJ/RimL family protein N-acetyltransferase
MAALRAPEPPLSDGAVTLRGWRDRDAADLAEMFDEPQIARWLDVPSPYRRRDAFEFLTAQPAVLAHGESIPLAITSREDRLLGSIGLHLRPDARGEFGYALASWARGGGFGTRALRLFSRWAFDELDLARLEVLVQPGNNPSLRMAERAGYRREGLLRAYRTFRGRRADFVMLSLLQDDRVV